MVELPDNLLADLKARIAQQQKTVEALNRDGHVSTDAERHLRELQSELRKLEASNRKSSGVHDSTTRSS